MDFVSFHCRPVVLIVFSNFFQAFHWIGSAFDPKGAKRVERHCVGEDEVGRVIFGTLGTDGGLFGGFIYLSVCLYCEGASI